MSFKGICFSSILLLSDEHLLHICLTVSSSLYPLLFNKTTKSEQRLSRMVLVLIAQVHSQSCLGSCTFSVHSHLPCAISPTKRQSIYPSAPHPICPPFIHNPHLRLSYYAKAFPLSPCALTPLRQGWLSALRNRNLVTLSASYLLLDPSLPCQGQNGNPSLALGGGQPLPGPNCLLFNSLPQQT